MTPSDETPRQLKALNKRISDLSLIQAVDLLTDEEVQELRLLVDLDGPEQSALFKKRSEVPETLACYKQLSDLGLIYAVEYAGGNFGFFGTDIKARWAIDRHDRRVERERRAARSDTMHKWLGHSFTLLSALLGVLLGWFLGRLG